MVETKPNVLISSFKQSGQKRARTVKIISHLWGRKWGRKSVPLKGTRTQGRRARYLEIINHIVTRRTDEEREATGEGEKEPRTTVSMDLSDTLINSKLLITDCALRAAIAFALPSNP